MATIQFNKYGVPLMISTSSAFMATTGAPNKQVIDEQKKKTDKTVNTKSDQDFFNLSGIDMLSWGSNNDFPQKANENITSIGVLNSGLKFLRNLTLGQGIYACTIDGYNADGSEILKSYGDPELQRYLQSRPIRRYLELVARDYFKFGSSAVQFIPSNDGKIYGLNPINAFFWRLSKRDPNTGKEKCVVSGKFPDTPGENDYNVYDVLLDFDPELDYNYKKLEGKDKEPFIYIVRDSWSNRDTYSEPVWLSAFLAGWIDIAREVPTFLRKVYKNQATWKWHIQIPYSFWDKKFPLANYDGDDAIQKRETDIQTYMDDIENNLLGTENAEKPIFTHYSINDLNGKIEEEWKITPLDNKSKEGDKLVTSAAANSEILFALLVNPNVLGAGMPGGTYAGNQGGSNIREAFLVNVANSWIDKQNLLDPLELKLKINGYPDCELRFRNTILTMLDTGSGTKSTQQ